MLAIFFCYAVLVSCVQLCPVIYEFLQKRTEQAYSGPQHGTCPAHHLYSQKDGRCPAPTALLALAPGCRGSRLERWPRARQTTCLFAVPSRIPLGFNGVKLCAWLNISRPCLTRWQLPRTTLNPIPPNVSGHRK